MAMEGGERGARIRVAEDFSVVRSIYIELLNALDPEAAPELVKNLAMTYAWVIRRLGELGREHDVEGVNGLIRVSGTMLEAFRHAAEHSGDVAAEAG
jgi:flagellin-specific chaperone FliS